MAAQKLTRARLVQIIVMMILLITAFIWRTLEYKPSNNAELCDFKKNICELLIDGAILKIQKEMLSNLLSAHKYLNFKT